MKTKDEYLKELSIIDGIRKCVFRYAYSISKEKDETQSEWCRDYLYYLSNRELKVQQKIYKLEKKQKGK